MGKFVPGKLQGQRISSVLLRALEPIPRLQTGIYDLYYSNLGKLS